MNQKILLSAILASSLLFVGCSSQTQSTTTTVQDQQKTGNTTLEGTVTNAGGKYYINSVGKPTTQIDSYTLKFDQYVGKKIKITGQYSGDTLYVDKIE